jgi:hypothetical protein
VTSEQYLTHKPHRLQSVCPDANLGLSIAAPDIARERQTVGGQTRFVCVDGPEFDGHQADFDNMMKRLGAYKRQEDEAHEKWHLDMASKAET